MFGEHYQNIWFQQDGAPPHYGIDWLSPSPAARFNYGLHGKGSFPCPGREACRRISYHTLF
ncbi:hypothetical protein J6590_096547 [Homalodisca vitripennis]|nr:hypothetical protein J6590_096547 [Homalodisca vitripennis]